MPHNIKTHPLFPNYGYEVREKPINLYLGSNAPGPGEQEPNMGVFYVSMDENSLSYTVKDPHGNTITAQISLQDMQTQLSHEDFAWPNPFSFESLIPVLSDIWQITAQRKHTLRNPVYVEDRTKAFPSDHLPIQGTVGNIRLVSWNTMGKGAANFSAFKFDEFEKVFDEHGYPVITNEHYADARYKNIIAILNNIQDKNLIHLQETNINIADLKIMLSEDWEIIDSVEATPRDAKQKERAALNRVVTCYRRDVFSLLAVKDNSCTQDGDRYLKLVLQEKASGQITDCYNVWTAYNSFPEVHEAYYKQKIEEGRISGHHVLIAGDTNTRMLPLSKKAQNITTGLIPPSFLVENAAYLADNTLMIPDFPDGIIYYNQQENSVNAVEWQVVDSTGNPFVAPTDDLDQMDEAERLMRTEYRATLSIDALGGNTEYNYLQTLQLQFNDIMDENIAIRTAVNSNNQRGIAVKFPSIHTPAYREIIKKLQESGIEPIRSRYDNAFSNTESQPVITVAENQCAQLLSAIISVANFAVLNVSRFQPRVDLLAASSTDTESLSIKKKRVLEELINDLKAVSESTTEAYKAIIDAWKKKQIQVTERHWFRADEVKTISYLDCISKHRSTFFGFGRTASKSLLDDLEQDLEQAQGKIITR